MLPSDRIVGRKAKDVYEHIRYHGTISKLDLREATGMTVSTLTRILDELTTLRLIEEVGFGESTGGRRPILYRTNADYAYVFGLEISRSTSKLVLCDLHLRKLDSRVWTVNRKMTPEALIHEVATEMQSMMDERGLSESDILGAGIGAVGPLDRMSGKLLNPPNFPAPGWKDVELCGMLQERISIAAYLDNGANSAILGEYWMNASERLEHLLYVHVGVGIRSSMIASGQLVYGAIDMEGAAGQMIIQADGAPSRQVNGNFGSWESYASTYAIEKAAKTYMKLGRETSLWKEVEDVEDLEYSAIERALAAKDPMVQEIFLQASCYFGIGLSNLLNILHPQKVILGGPLISGNDLFFQNAIEVARSKTYHISTYDVIFEKSRLGDDAVATGAAAAVVRQLTI